MKSFIIKVKKITYGLWECLNLRTYSVVYFDISEAFEGKFGINLTLKCFNDLIYTQVL